MISCMKRYHFLKMQESDNGKLLLQKINKLFDLDFEMKGLKNWTLGDTEIYLTYENKDIFVSFVEEGYLKQIDYEKYMVRYLYDNTGNLLREDFEYMIGDSEYISYSTMNNVFTYKNKDKTLTFCSIRNEFPFLRLIFWENCDNEKEQCIKIGQCDDNLYYFNVDRKTNDIFSGNYIKCNLGISDEIEQLNIDPSFDYVMFEHNNPFIDFYFFKDGDNFDFISMEKVNEKLIVLLGTNKLIEKKFEIKDRMGLYFSVDDIKEILNNKDIMNEVNNQEYLKKEMNNIINLELENEREKNFLVTPLEFKSTMDFEEIMMDMYVNSKYYVDLLENTDVVERNRVRKC